MTNHIYRATITFISRGQRRGGINWSTKRVQQSLGSLGYKCEPAINGQPHNALLQKVDLKGTRDKIIHDRKEISSQLRIMSGGRIGIKFKLHEG